MRPNSVASIGLDMRVETLRTNISELLGNAILSGKFRPGERLNESALARQMKVSRAPIREALQQLQEQGLVINQPRRGMFVVALEEEELQKINSLRLLLEAEALRLCRVQATPQTLRRFKQLLGKMERSQNTTAIEAGRMDLEFHRTLWMQSGNEFLHKTLMSLTAPVFAYAVLTKPKAVKMRMILDSHEPQYEYVAGISERSADDVMLEHLALRWHEPDRFSARKLSGRANM